jgi:hypothetical protein
MSAALYKKCSISKLSDEVLAIIFQQIRDSNTTADDYLPLLTVCKKWEVGHDPITAVPLPSLMDI